MKLVFKPEAEEALFELGVWVEQHNTAESGVRFTDKFIDKIASYALSGVKYGLWKNKVLALRMLSCIVINDWVVAFTQTGDEFVVHYILFGPGLR